MRVQRNHVGKEETMAVGAQSAEKKGLGRTGRKRREKIGNSGQELLRPQKTFHQRRLESGSFTHAKWPPRRSCAPYFIFALPFFFFFFLRIPNPVVECDVITEREQAAFAAACSSCQAADLGSRAPMPILLFSSGHAGHAGRWKL